MKVSLHSTAHPAAAHRAVFLPWLRRAVGSAGCDARPVLVVVPFRSDAYYLKGCALAVGIGVLGVHFVTPSELREKLARLLGLTSRVPLREHLRLLLATGAERLAMKNNDDAASAVAAAPDHLLKAIDILRAGGWPFAEAGPAALRPVVAEFERLVSGSHFQLVHDADRELRQRMKSAPSRLAALFVTGFNGAHWPVWPLLAAAVHGAEEATVCLTDPRSEAETLDATWIGTWEETFGAATPVPADEMTRPFVEILSLPESKTEAARRQEFPAANVEFLAGHDTAEQARAVVTKALHFLANPACERLGIVFAAAGSLSRRVAELLAEQDVPHHDGLAHRAPGPLEDAAWPAWCELQESPRVPALLRFLRAHPEPARFFGGRALAEVEDALERTFGELLIDDLAVVAEYLAQHPRRRLSAELVAGLRALPFLPERAPLAVFIAETEAIFRALDWSFRALELRRLAVDWRAAESLVVSRRTWLRWLRETLISWRATRAEAGNHPYSRVHLLVAAQAEAQSWTHLILAGLNEGQWPPALEDSGFLGEEEIDALNRRIRGLNERASVQGRQGEGHLTVQPGRALCLGPAQRRELALREFLNVIESATVAVAATVQLFDEGAPDRRMNPSDFFTRLYFCARGRAVSSDAVAALRAETARWLDASELWNNAPPDLEAVQQTRIAFDARREVTQPFGKYEFALDSAPPKAMRLSATDWEKVFKSPALVWMKHLLGVKPREASDETPWNLATGQWAHQWLRALSDATEPNTFAPLPAPTALLARVRESAAIFRARLLEILRVCDRPAPDWLLSAWQQALHIAEALAQRIAEVAGQSHAATEWTLAETPLGGAAKIHVRGRIDLLLTAAPPLLAVPPDEAWIVDYKTGNRKALTVKTLRAGEGLQLALYALALRELGTAQVGLSLLTPTLELAAPQLTLEDLRAPEQQRLWRGLLRMQESGVFGQRGKLRDEFSFGGDYPLATLAIDRDLLEEKWALTHPDFREEEEEKT